MPLRSVLFCDCELDVDRSQDGEDVRLEEGHQDFKEGVGKTCCQRTDTKNREP